MPRVRVRRSFVTKQIGMFTYTGMTRPQCEVLTNKHHIYLTMVREVEEEVEDVGAPVGGDNVGRPADPFVGRAPRAAQDGRISMAGLNSAGAAKLAAAMKDALATAK